MPGPVKQFPDFTQNTNNDTGENNADSIQPIEDGENVVGTVLQRPSESLRQRTEVVRSIEMDSLYLRDADRNLIISGPGKITWPGSTTAAASGIPVISDNLYLIPMLTPGAAQTPPIPPVASAYGTLSLARASDSMNSILVTSQRRSYAAGDQISIDVTAGGSFSCTLDAETTYQRTIHIIATGSTQLSTVISALNALMPTAPDNTALVTAALQGGALGTDLLLTTQAKQFVAGNYDGEGHVITPANLASFFVSNPTQALAEGDTLCANFAMVSDTASTGGRRQAIPENSNTAITAGAYFNSRVHPENLVNALPICKVVNGRLVFGIGAEILAGSVNADLGEAAAGSITYNGGPNWADGTTNPATTVENQLDKIIGDLAGSTGTGKIQGSAVGSELGAATLSTQIVALIAKSLGWITIGNGTTIIGNFNTNGFANSNALLVAALAALPAAGGRIYIKPGVSLTNFNSATVALPAGKTVEIIGDHAGLPTNAPHMTFAAGEGIACSATGALVLTNLHVSYNGTSPFLLQASPFKVRNVYLSNTSTTASTSLAAIRDGAGATAIGNVDIDGLTWSTNFSAVQSTGALFRVFAGGLVCSDTRILNVTHNNAAHEAGAITIPIVGNNVEVGHVTVNQSFATVGIVSQGYVVTLGTGDNAHVHDITVNNTAGSIPQLGMLSLTGTGRLRVARLLTDATSVAVTVVGSGVVGPLLFEDCVFAVPGISVTFLGVVGDTDFSRCRFLNGSLFSVGDGSDVVGRIRCDKCFFSGSLTATDLGSAVFGTFVEQVLVLDCTFDSISDVNVADFAIITVAAGVGIVREARFLRNTVSNFQNVTYTGADATSTPVFFEINALQVDIAECSDTTMHNIMNSSGGSAGNARRAPYVFSVTTNTANTGAFGNINFERNKSQWWSATEGTVFSEACQALTVTNFLSIQNLVIDSNEFAMPYNTSTGARTNNIYVFDGKGSGTAGINLLRWTNNKTQIGVGDADPTGMAIDVLYGNCGASFGMIGQLVLTGNCLNGGHASTSFNYTSHWGVGIFNYGAAVTMVHDNIATRLTSHLVTGFWQLEFNTPAQIYNVNGDGGTLPGAGTTFLNCCNFWLGS